MSCTTKTALRVSTALLLVATSCFCCPLLVSAQQEAPTEVAANVQPVSAAVGGSQSIDLAAQSSSNEATTEKFVLPMEKHRWSKFPVGSWREISITTETTTVAAESINRSVTTKVEKLQSANSQQYTLEVQATVNVVGKQVVGPPITRELNSLTDQMGAILESRQLTDQDLMLTLGPFPCQVWEVVYEEDSQRLIDRLHYSAERFPYIIRRETTAEPGDPDESLLMQEVTTVVAAEVPYQIGEETQLCTCLRTVRQGEKGSTVTVSMVSDSVPGGEVAVWSTDFDLQGVRTLWSSQKLVSFGTTPRVEKPLSRRELRRLRRSR